MTQVLHKTRNMFRLSLENIERTTPYYKKKNQYVASGDEDVAERESIRTLIPR